MESIKYQNVEVDGIKIFYRSAGNPLKTALVLLNGVPNASSAFQELINDLKNDFYLVAPDLPGFGNSEAPSQDRYDYTFHQLSVTIEHFIDQLNLNAPSVYALGYGGPLTFRIAMRRPDLFTSYIFQNTNAYEEGLGPAMSSAAPFLEHRNEETEQLVKPLLSLDGIKLFFLNGAADPSAINPDAYHNALYYLNRPGQEKLQLDLLYDYRTNISEYPKWQKWLKDYQPHLLLVWGKNDVFFPLAAAEAIKKDVPHATLQVYDTSHLALEEYHEDIAVQITSFLNQQKFR